MSADAAALGLRLALASLVLHPIGVGWLRPAIVGLAVAGLIVPRAVHWPLLWLALAGLCGLRVIGDWPLSDNHAYLLAYFCLAVGLAPLARDPGAALGWNARLLIGFAFLLAVGWKLASPDFLDGRFFRVTWLADVRFEPLVRFGVGLDAASLDAWRTYLTEPPASGVAIAPPEPARLRALALGASFSAVALEAAVALAFLWPPGRGPSRLRDPLLLFFCATTYAMAPVAGFGWLLLALGWVQGESASRVRARAYLAVFALVFLYRAAAGEPSRG